MRARADARIFAIAPIDQIVSALGTGTRMVGNLIGRKPQSAGGFLRHIPQGARRVGVGHGEFSGVEQPLIHGVGLDGELVERQMFGGMCNRRLQFFFPGGGRLAGARIDEIEGEALEDRGRDRHSRHGLVGCMQPPERFQVGIVHRLHAQRHAIDASRAIAAKALRLDAGGIGLQRDLRVAVDAPGPANGVENGRHRLRLHQRGRAATKEDRRYLAPRCQRRAMGDLGPERRHESRLVHRLVADMGVEVAIGAFREAEGPVDIDPEARLEIVISGRHGGPYGMEPSSLRAEGRNPSKRQPLDGLPRRFAPRNGEGSQIRRTKSPQATGGIPLPLAGRGQGWGSCNARKCP